MLPLLTIPFLFAFFWALGGGKGGTVLPVEKIGINAELPQASNPTEELDKMSFYEQAEKDSSGLSELKDSDPYLAADNYRRMHLDTDDYKQDVSLNYISGDKKYAKEAELNNKLAALQMAVNQPPSTSFNDAGVQQSSKDRSGVNTADIDRLESMMRSMSSNSGDDPEMQQINGMLDKILDVQDPARIAERRRQQSIQVRGQVLSVSTVKPELKVGSLTVNKKEKLSSLQGNKFFTIDEPNQPSDTQNSIRATVDGFQTLVNGSDLRMRLETDVYVNGVLIPKSSVITGKCSISGERLMVRISSLTYSSSVFPVDLVVFDNDGTEGIYVPGAISREVAKSSGESGLQGIGLNSMDQSLAVQAASVGVEAVKGFLSKKVKLVRVFVNTGHQILLSDQKQK